MNLSEYLIWFETRRVVAGEEVVCLDHTLAAVSRYLDTAIESEECCRQLCTGVGVRDAAADRPPRSNLPVPDVVKCLDNQRAIFSCPQIILECPLAHHRADDKVAVFQSDIRKPRDVLKINEERWLCDPEAEKGEKTLSARQHLGVRIARERSARLVQGARRNIIEIREFYYRSSNRALRPSGRSTRG